jgi:hypothetical protein
LAKIAKDLGVSKNTLIGRALTGNLNVIGKQISADAQVQAAKERAKGKGAGKPPRFDRYEQAYKVELDNLLAEGESDTPATRKKAMNLAQDRLSQSAGTVRADTDKVDKANKEFRNRYYDQSNAVLRAKRLKDPVGYTTGMKALRDSIEASYGVRPDAQIAETPTLAPAPAPTQAPAAGAITPEAFQAKWATLKPNQTLVGPDGVTYTKK